MGMNLSSGGGKGKRPQPIPVVNVTPLVDVALVVLIIFMVVTPLMTKTFWLNLPKQEKLDKPPPEESSNQPLVLTVDKSGVYRVNKTVLSKAELSERLPRMLAAKNQRVLYFDAHDELEYGKAVEAMDLSRQGGARSIAILTQKVVF
jgi:biopolymer transport protein ExbD